MEVFDYDKDNEEYDRILEESDPCPDCGRMETLALVVVTSEEDFGSLLIFCTECHIDEEDEFSLERDKQPVYA